MLWNQIHVRNRRGMCIETQWYVEGARVRPREVREQKRMMRTPKQPSGPFTKRTEDPPRARQQPLCGTEGILHLLRAAGAFRGLICAGEPARDERRRSTAGSCLTEKRGRKHRPHGARRVYFGLCFWCWTRSLSRTNLALWLAKQETVVNSGKKFDFPASAE